MQRIGAHLGRGMACYNRMILPRLYDTLVLTNFLADGY
jgi:hypothetical protein